MIVRVEDDDFVHIKVMKDLTRKGQEQRKEVYERKEK